MHQREMYPIPSSSEIAGSPVSLAVADASVALSIASIFNCSSVTGGLSCCGSTFDIDTIGRPNLFGIAFFHERGIFRVTG